MSKTKTYLEMKKKRTVPKELVEKSKEFNRIKKLFTQALKAGPKTVPEVAAELNMPSAEAMYWMMTLRKYELIVETEEVTDEGYYKYTLVKRGK
jgi:DNA-directed RNA polymerase specialized sigma subunit